MPTQSLRTREWDWIGSFTAETSRQQCRSVAGMKNDKSHRWEKETKQQSRKNGQISTGKQRESKKKQETLVQGVSYGWGSGEAE